jgi:hypothetical protein
MPLNLVWGGGAGLGQNLAPLDLVSLHAAKKGADVVARLGVVKQLAEHFDTVTTVFWGASIRPTISTSSAILRVPLSTLP